MAALIDPTETRKSAASSLRRFTERASGTLRAMVPLAAAIAIGFAAATTWQRGTSWVIGLMPFIFGIALGAVLFVTALLVRGTGRSRRVVYSTLVVWATAILALAVVDTLVSLPSIAIYGTAIG